MPSIITTTEDLTVPEDFETVVSKVNNAVRYGFIRLDAVGEGQEPRLINLSAILEVRPA